MEDFLNNIQKDAEKYASMYQESINVFDSKIESIPEPHRSKLKGVKAKIAEALKDRNKEKAFELQKELQDILKEIR